MSTSQVVFTLQDDELQWLGGRGGTGVIDIVTRFASETIDTEWVLKAVQVRRGCTAKKLMVGFPPPFPDLVRDLDALVGQHIRLRVGPSAAIWLAIRWGMSLWPIEGEPDPVLARPRRDVAEAATAHGPQLIVWASVDGLMASMLQVRPGDFAYVPVSLASTRFRRDLTRSGNPNFDDVLDPKHHQSSVMQMIQALGDRAALQWAH